MKHLIITFFTAVAITVGLVLFVCVMAVYPSSRHGSSRMPRESRSAKKGDGRTR